MDENTRLKTLANEVYQRLLTRFGLPVWRTPLSAMDELISTILSQNTNDHNRDIAFNRLRDVLPTWEAVRDAPLIQVIEAIRTAGLANQKGARIQQVLREITLERGDLNLDFLREFPRDDAYAWLVKFKGVGPKTASIVMQFALDMPAFPVDTHIHRVSGRIGLRPDGMNAEQAHTHLAGLFQPEQYGPAHLNLIRLGRELCHPRKPECTRCPLNDICQYSAARGS
jgi:endonuclease-3